MNRIIFILDDHCRRIERIDFDAKLHQTDVISGLLAKLFRPAYWGALRFLCHGADGEQLFEDRRQSPKV